MIVRRSTSARRGALYRHAPALTQAHHARSIHPVAAGPRPQPTPPSGIRVSARITSRSRREATLVFGLFVVVCAGALRAWLLAV
jgi:hypothetical protein